MTQQEKNDLVDMHVKTLSIGADTVQNGYHYTASDFTAYTKALAYFTEVSTKLQKEYEL